MDYIAHLFTQPWTVGIFVGIIVLVAFRPLYLALFTIAGTNKDLKKACDILEKLDSEKKQQAFYNNFEEVNQKIMKIHGLDKIWHEFVDTLFSTSPEQHPNRIYLSHRPSEYFHRESVLGTRMNLSQFLAFPNYLIGLGLTFTFIGLAAALHVAQAGLSTPGGGQQALQDLLAVASIKFASSIAGILSSLFISCLQRYRLKVFHDQLAVFCNLIEKCTEYKSSEKLLFETYQEQQKQTGALNDMAANISKGIGDVLSNQLPSSVAQALQPLANEIHTLAQKFSGSNQDALEKVLQEFLGQLRKSTGDDMQGLIDSVKILKTSLDTLVSNIQSMGENFGADTKASTQRLTVTLENFVNSFVPVQQGIGQFGNALVNLEAIAEKIEKAGGSISGAADINHQSMSNLAGTVGNISDQMMPLQELFVQMAHALIKVNETSVQLQSAGSTIAHAADGFRHSAEAMEQAGGRFHQKIETFESLADGISGTVVTLERASHQVSTAAQPLSEISQGMIRALHLLQETETRIHNNQQELNNMLLEMQKFSQIIPELWSQYEGRFNKVDTDLGKAFEQLASGSEQFRSHAEVFVRTFDEQFAKAIKGLSGAINELTEEREQNHIQKTQLG